MESRILSTGDMLEALRERGARRLVRVAFRRNRSTIWSLTRDATVLNLHAVFRRSPPHLVDAFALIARQRGRKTAAVRSAAESIRRWPPLDAAFRSIRSSDERAPARDGGGGERRGSRCHGTPAQRAYVRSLYDYFNQTRFEGILPDDVPLRLSARMRRRFGHMMPGRRADGERYVAEIALNIHLLRAEHAGARVDTLLHEMAHAADYLVHGGRGHGATWRAWARRVGCRPSATCKDETVLSPRGVGGTTRVPPAAPTWLTFHGLDPQAR